MQPTIKDIARSLRVSVATVSNALAGKGRVSAPMAERVRAEALRQGYRPRIAGRALRTGRSGVIGLVLPDLANPLFPCMAQALQHAAEKAGLGMLIADSHGNSAAQGQAIERLVDRGADGVILIPRRGTAIPAPGVPLAVIDTPATAGNAVGADHRGGGLLVMQHLLGLGHRRFVFVGESAQSSVQLDRIAAMNAACPPTAQAQTLWLDSTEIGAVLQQVRAGATAICATSDLVALPIISALHAAGLRIPADVSITGFDNLAFSNMVHPSLTSVAADTGKIAAHAVATLGALIGNATPPAPAVVPMHLIQRNSTGPAPAPNREKLT